MKVSVVMATYNGEEYIYEQATSIYKQLVEGDELIVSDDGSKDTTLNIIKSLANDHPKIKTMILNGPRRGTPSNFAHGLSAASGDIVFFADQDDIWLPEKRNRVCLAFEENPTVSLVTHDAFYGYPDGTRASLTIFEDRGAQHGFVRNLVKSTYFGCCMAMRASFVKDLVPDIASSNCHDQFVSLIAERRHLSLFLKDPLIIHRMHGSNQSQKLSILGMIKHRARLCRSVLNSEANGEPSAKGSA